MDMQRLNSSRHDVFVQERTEMDKTSRPENEWNKRNGAEQGERAE